MPCMLLPKESSASLLLFAMWLWLRFQRLSTQVFFNGKIYVLVSCFVEQSAYVSCEQLTMDSHSCRGDSNISSSYQNNQSNFLLLTTQKSHVQSCVSAVYWACYCTFCETKDWSESCLLLSCIRCHVQNT